MKQDRQDELTRVFTTSCLQRAIRQKFEGENFQGAFSQLLASVS